MSSESQHTIHVSVSSFFLSSFLFLDNDRSDLTANSRKRGRQSCRNLGAFQKAQSLNTPAATVLAWEIAELMALESMTRTK